jgi:formylglycine-generating enzyme required for sulfatase activity
VSRRPEWSVRAATGLTAAGLASAGLAAAAMLVASCTTNNFPAARSAADSPLAVAARIEMVNIPAGRFVMGTDPSVSFQNGFPRHGVNIAAFRMARNVVTFDEYDAFARATGRNLPTDEGWGRGNRPVINVSWRDAQAFVLWLNRGTRRQFRLPSEAEFEYAARAGATTLYWWGDEPDPDKANTAANVGRDQYPYTSPVGAFPPNAFGLHDMAGNIWQMTQDCRHGSYEGAPVDGSAWLDGPCTGRVVRGGGFGGIRRAMQTAARAAAGETFESAELGFRLAENP